QETKHENVTNIDVEEPKSKEPKSQKGFMEFLEETREKYKGNSAIDFYPLLFKNGDDEIKVSAKGYLYSKNTSDDLEPLEAKKIWEYLYRHQDRIAPIEPQSRIIDRVHKPMDSTNHTRSNHDKKVLQSQRGKSRVGDMLVKLLEASKNP
ncbi:MAG: hypothetical protein JXQ76_05945, partial [Campylobacterales bacterium]|nr:hypothetical protein [Campylobacterales bacterium]